MSVLSFLRPAAGAALVALGLAAPAVAQTPGVEALVGQVFEGYLPIDGWEDYGGGLFAEPVWFAHYRRADDSRLILVLWELPRAPGAEQARFQVTDVALIAPIPAGYELSFACHGPRVDITRSTIAVARIDEMAEEWTDLAGAWQIDHASGRIGPVRPAGIACVNEGLGL